MQLREYRPSDQPTCRAILASNLELHFALGDDVLYLRFLQNLPGWYGVVEVEHRIVACGGIAIDGDIGVLTWGMVDASLQGQGFGRFLLVERLRMLRERPEVRVVRMNTSQNVLGFYLKHGFVVTSRQPDGYRA